MDRLTLILGFLLTALYWPGIAGAATTPRWALLAIAMPIMLIRSDPGKFTAAHLFGLGYLAWMTTSLIWTSNRLDGIGELIKLMILAQAFVLGSRLQNIRPIVLGMALGIVLSTVLLFMQQSDPDVVLHTTANSGLFINSGSLGEIAALVLIGLAATLQQRGEGFGWAPHSSRMNMRWDFLRKKRTDLSSKADQTDGRPERRPTILLIIALLPCLMLPQSRGAWLAVLAAALVWIWGYSRISALVVAIFACLLFGWSIEHGFHIASITQRLGLWSDAISGMTWLGHGIGSFWTDYAPLSTTVDIFVERPEHLHSDPLEIAFEGGVVGSILLGATLACICVRGNLLPRLVFAGFAAEAAVGFPLHVPCTAFLAALCLGHLARDGADLRQYFDVWRDRLYSGSRGIGAAGAAR